MRKQFTRNENEKVLGGVIAGLADYLGQDPVLLRILAILIMLITGLFPGALIYLIAWVFVPQQGSQTADYTIDSE